MSSIAIIGGMLARRSPGLIRKPPDERRAHAQRVLRPDRRHASGKAAAARSIANVLPPLALTVADEVEAQIAVIKELKSRQRVYAAEHRGVAAAKRAAMARGMVAARDIRACAVLVYGPKDARITRFGIRIRRRPVRKARTEIPDAGVQVQVQASPVCQDEPDLTAVLDEVRIPPESFPPARKRSPGPQTLRPGGNFETDPKAVSLAA
jgi:hypothetical protein